MVRDRPTVHRVPSALGGEAHGAPGMSLVVGPPHRVQGGAGSPCIHPSVYLFTDHVSVRPRGLCGPALSLGSPKSVDGDRVHGVGGRGAARPFEGRCGQCCGSFQVEMAGAGPKGWNRGHQERSSRGEQNVQGPAVGKRVAAALIGSFGSPRPAGTQGRAE